MIKFWLALILGTIAIASGLTYLKLNRGAQTISYPPPAPKTKPAVIEFTRPQTALDDIQMTVSANVVTFESKETVADTEKAVAFKVSNTGEGTLQLSLRHSSCTCAEIYFDQKRVTMTDHLVTVQPSQSVQVRLVYKPKYDPSKNPGDKTRITATFQHNDERYNDNLHFEIVTEVKTK